MATRKTYDKGWNKLKGTSMKKCDKVKDLFGAYLHDDVTSAERAAVEEHISNCEECTVDLQSRQKVLEMLKPDPQPDGIPQRTQDDFSRNVYKRIARDAMHQRSRQIRTRRFVLQPAFAAVALAAVLVIGVTQFHSGDGTIGKLTAVAPADKAAQLELKGKELREKFLARQGMIPERETSYVTTDKVSVADRSSSGVSYRVQDALLPDLQRRLENANFIDYSLGDWKRALAKYRQLVDDYPGTDVAEEARGRMRAISGMEYGIQVEDVGEGQTTDTEI